MPSSCIALELFDQTQFVLVVEVLQEKLKKLLFFSLLFFSFLGGCCSGIESLLSKSIGDLFLFFGDLLSLPTNANQKP
jgi:hypothetical protein